MTASSLGLQKPARRRRSTLDIDQLPSWSESQLDSATGSFWKKEKWAAAPVPALAVSETPATSASISPMGSPLGSPSCSRLPPPADGTERAEFNPNSRTAPAPRVRRDRRHTFDLADLGRSASLVLSHADRAKWQAHFSQLRSSDESTEASCARRFRPNCADRQVRLPPPDERSSEARGGEAAERSVLRLLDEALPVPPIRRPVRACVTDTKQVDTSSLPADQVDEVKRQLGLLSRITHTG